MAYPKLGRTRIEGGVRIGREELGGSVVAEEWRQVLETWHSSVQEYCEWTEEDNPYWYNERANVSLLAAAAWKAGFVALEEYSSTKNLAAAQSSRCRTDLYIGGNEWEYQIEAKQHWMHAHMNAKTLTRRINGYLEEALGAAQQNTEIKGGRIGCVFFVPYFSQSRRYGNGGGGLS